MVLHGKLITFDVAAPVIRPTPLKSLRLSLVSCVPRILGYQLQIFPVQIELVCLGFVTQDQ